VTMKPTRKFPLKDSNPPVFHCLGLLTDVPDYRMCWMLNEHYHLRLISSPDLQVTLPKSPVPQSFSHFSSRDGEGKITFRLVSNQSREGLWLTRYHQVNFLLLTANPPDPSGILSDLRQHGKEHFPELLGIFDLLPDEVSGLIG